MYTSSKKSSITQHEQGQLNKYSDNAPGSTTKDPWSVSLQGPSDGLTAWCYTSAPPICLLVVHRDVTFVQNQIATLQRNNDFKIATKVAVASSERASQHLHTAPDKNYKMNPNASHQAEVLNTKQQHYMLCGSLFSN
jgi:hypothetical protein